MSDGAYVTDFCHDGKSFRVVWDKAGRCEVYLSVGDAFGTDYWEKQWVGDLERDVIHGMAVYFSDRE